MMKNLKERYVLFEEFPELMDEEPLESAMERAEEFFGPEELRHKFLPAVPGGGRAE